MFYPIGKTNWWDRLISILYMKKLDPASSVSLNITYWESYYFSSINKIFEMCGVYISSSVKKKVKGLNVGRDFFTN